MANNSPRWINILCVVLIALLGGAFVVMVALMIPSMPQTLANVLDPQIRAGIIEEESRRPLFWAGLAGGAVACAGAMSWILKRRRIW